MTMLGSTILPGTGRGTTRRVVEEHALRRVTSPGQMCRPCRSTPALRAAVPLPVPVRIG
jgi:hypothetical protein